MSRHRRSARAALLGAILALMVPALAAAHPLGNFTINHYADLRVAANRIDLDVVIDEAEIPTFQERQRLDLDGNGAVSAGEIETERLAACDRLAANLELTVGGAAQQLATVASGLSFPAGAGGLSTMRLVCEYAVQLSSAIAAGTTIDFHDSSFAERIGWREIVVEGDGIALSGSGTSAIDRSARLTHYPTDLLSQPLNVRGVSFSAAPGGPGLPAWTAPDAEPLGATGPAGATPGLLAAVPGGVGLELAGIIDARDLSPLVLVGSLLLALALGAAHAISPGHGKTIMAAYLVGSRGTTRHALGLGLSVAISHTLGVLVLAGITLAFARVLPPERLYPILGLASGGLVVAIGSSLLLNRVRSIAAGRGGRTSAAARHDHAHDPGHDHGPTHDHDQGHGQEHEHGHGHGQEHEHGHGGGHGHSHEIPAGAPLSWRTLFVLGLSGGLVPSASALILLLGSISTGRIGYGMVLVLAFGIGMAAVLGGVGLAMVHATRLFGHIRTGPRLVRASAALQVATAGLVVVLGVALTGQALTQVL